MIGVEIIGQAIVFLALVPLGWWVMRELRGQRRRQQVQVQRRARERAALRARRNGGRW